MACNRADYLERTINSVLKYASSQPILFTCILYLIIQQFIYPVHTWSMYFSDTKGPFRQDFLYLYLRYFLSSLLGVSGVSLKWLRHCHYFANANTTQTADDSHFLLFRMDQIQTSKIRLWAMMSYLICRYIHLYKCAVLWESAQIICIHLLSKAVTCLLC